MRLSLVWTLTQKELLDMLRDRRTLMVMMLLPIVIYPLFGIIAGQAQFVRQKNLDKARFTVGIIGLKHVPRLAKKIGKTDDVKALGPKDNWKQAMRKGDLSLVVQLGVIPPKPSKTVAKPNQQAFPQLWVRIFYASTRDSSRVVLRRIHPLLKQFRRAALKHRLHRQNLPFRFVRPVVLVTHDVVTYRGKGRYAMGMLFPALLIILTVTGAFYPAIDLTAGEKERGTLETLLTAPITSLEIVAGKYLAVWCIASFAGALNLLSLWFTFSHGLRLAGKNSGIQLGLHLHHYAVIFGFLVLFAALSSAVMMGIASLARSFKEAQNYVTPAYLFCVLPAILPSLPGAKATLAMACIPVVNVAFAIQQAINGHLSPSFFLISLLSMVVSIALALWVTSKIFAFEQVLFREGEFSFLPKKDQALRPLRGALSVEESIFLLGALFVMTFYLMAPLQLWDPAIGLAVQLWGLVLLVPLWFARSRNIDLRKSLRLVTPSPWALVGAVCLALGFLPIASGLTELVNGALFPDWRAFVEVANRTFSLEYFGLGTGMFFFLLALSPGICEEFLFRGLILSSLRKRLPVWPAIFLTALLFGAFHLHLYRLFPTSLIGIMLGWLCVRTGSIWPAITAHATNNAVALGLSIVASKQVKLSVAAAPTDLAWLGISELQWQGLFTGWASQLNSWSGIGVGLLLIGVGVFCVWRLGPRGAS